MRPYFGRSRPPKRKAFESHSRQPESKEVFLEPYPLSNQGFEILSHQPVQKMVY